MRKYTGMKKDTPEGIIKKGIRRFLKFEGIFYWNVFSGPMAEPGIPDIVAIVPVAGRFGKIGRFVGIEVKVPGKDLTKPQREKKELIEASFGLWITARSTEDVMQALGLAGKYHLDLPGGQKWKGET